MQPSSPLFPKFLSGVLPNFAKQVLEVMAPALQQFADGIRRFPLRCAPYSFSYMVEARFIMSPARQWTILRFGEGTFKRNLEHKQFDELDKAMSGLKSSGISR